MAILTNEKQLDTVLERYYNRYNKYNEKVLEELGRTVKEIGELKPSEVYRLSQKIKYSDDIDKLIQELADITDKSTEDIEKLFEKFAKENTEFSEAYKEAKNEVGYNNNVRLQRLVTGMANNTKNTMKNLSNTSAIGFVYKDNNGNTTFKGLKQTYYDLVDEAVYQVSTGTKDYGSAMRNVLNSLADSGIRTHQDKIGYKSGYSRRLDTSIRQNILEGLRQSNADMQQQIGEQIGADGIEVSAHFPCAFDHLDIQGRQFTEDEYKDENGSLSRHIGTYNCHHFVMSIVLGVDRPMYSDEQLEEWKRKSYEKFEYDGKMYTPYEATQMQRRLETEIRKQKDRQIINRASGDMDEVRKAQQRISELTSKYNDFSMTAGLKTYKDRLAVSGYRRIKVSNSTSKTFDQWQTHFGKKYGSFDVLKGKTKYNSKLDNFVEIDKGLRNMNNDLLNDNLKQIEKIYDKYNMNNLGLRVSYENSEDKYVALARGKSKISFHQSLTNRENIIERVKDNVKHNFYMKINKGNESIYPVTHEMGHILENRIINESNIVERSKKDNEIKDMLLERTAKRTDLSVGEIKKVYLSEYANSRKSFEWFAETFTQLELGEKNIWIEEFEKWLKTQY